MDCQKVSIIFSQLSSSQVGFRTKSSSQLSKPKVPKMPIPDPNQKAIDELIAKTNAEIAAGLARLKNPKQNSRTWTHPEGYRYLVQWSNSVLLRFLVTVFTSTVRSFKRKDQLEDAARSVVRDIEEGYKRANTSPYIEFISFSQGSLEEVKGDIRDATQDGLLKSVPGSSLASIGIDLKKFNEALRPLPSSKDPLNSSNLKDNKGEYRKVKEPESDKKIFAFKPLQEIYPPLSKIQSENLTYEIFLELINKTDYLLRVLVQSLEKKLQNDKKGYQIEQAKIKDKTKWRR